MAAAHPDSDQLAELGLLPPQAAFTLPRPDPGDVLRDRYRGCLLAGAAGDALGRPAEGVSRAVLEERYPTGLREFQPWPGWQKGPRGTFTDDTQLSIVMAEWIADAGAGQPRASDAATRILAGLRSAGASAGPHVRLSTDSRSASRGGGPAQVLPETERRCGLLRSPCATPDSPIS